MSKNLYDKPEMTACRCFRYIAMLTEDEKILELCKVGEKHAKEMRAKIEELKNEIQPNR